MKRRGGRKGRMVKTPVLAPAGLGRLTADPCPGPPAEPPRYDEDRLIETVHWYPPVALDEAHVRPLEEDAVAARMFRNQPSHRETSAGELATLEGVPHLLGRL